MSAHPGVDYVLHRSGPERVPEILRLVESKRRIGVAELARLIGVSQVTIRQDLDSLAQQGLLIRIHGAALAVDSALGEVDFQVRLQKEKQEKIAIAQAAAGLVSDGEVVALDASSTAYYVALQLKSRSELVVVTNSLRIGSALLDAPQISVVLTGGVLRRAANSMVGELGEGVVAKTKIGKGFFGCAGISLDGGLLDLNAEEVRLKRAMVAACMEPIGILDNTKWHRGGLLSFATVDRVAALITDAKAPTDSVSAWEKRGVRVTRVDTSDAAAQRSPAEGRGTK